ncbi:MAG: hypothetical protein M1297_07090 [Nitrospirae bacterium]|nr:hypothetical protein [Nitrospirota bacterium]
MSEGIRKTRIVPRSGVGPIPPERSSGRTPSEFRRERMGVIAIRSPFIDPSKGVSS